MEPNKTIHCLKWQPENPEHEIMLMGVHRFKRLVEIPASYYLWFDKNVPPNNANQYIKDFINQNRNELERLAAIEPKPKK